MKVYIGPYVNWFGPHQIAEKLLFWKNEDDDAVYEFGKTLVKSKLLVAICKYIDSKRARKIQVRIDNYDTWSMDHTLAYIALPMLKQLREKKHGAPFVEDEDVPEHLRRTIPWDNEHYKTDDLWFARWDWVMDEMIFAFESKVTDSEEPYVWDEHRELLEKRIQNGFVLFGKYFQSLWD